jgi:hypothetical protein
MRIKSLLATCFKNDGQFERQRTLTGSIGFEGESAYKQMFNKIHRILGHRVEKFLHSGLGWSWLCLRELCTATSGSGSGSGSSWLCHRGGPRSKTQEEITSFASRRSTEAYSYLHPEPRRRLHFLPPEQLLSYTRKIVSYST